MSYFLDYLKALPFYRGQMAHVEPLPQREASHGELESPLHPTLEAALKKRGLLPLYSHQAQAINAARRGENVIAATSSASGKTLCYNVPVLDALLSGRGGRALYLFPTKALAQDQLRSLGELAPSLRQAPSTLRQAQGTAGSGQRQGSAEVRSATYDRDTPVEERAGIRKGCHIVLTNPDMLHVGILPNHSAWSPFLSRLQFVVIDEAHIYRGVFGSHVALVLRRLRRLCRRYGSQPCFIACSATIANPGEHLERLVGLPFRVVDEDGSAHGSKDFVFWNPPVIDEAKAARRSANSEAAHLMSELLLQGKRSLAFARSRRLTELIAMYVREELERTSPTLAQRVKAYRAGFLAQDRRRIEAELFSGQLLGAVATTALELGVDIGDLEATVLVGYPGSIASTWQQAGRSGRRGGESLSFLIGLDGPLDQYLMRHPEAFFGRSHEHALINPENPHILRPHLLCAAWEQPLSAADGQLFGPPFDQAVTELDGEGLLKLRTRRWYPSASLSYPAQDLGLRSASSQSYALVDASRGNEVLETIEAATAFFHVYPGAIYLHQGEAYLVRELDLLSRIAYAVPTEAAYYTHTKDLTDLRILKVLREGGTPWARVYLGEVEVTTTVVGFKKKRIYTEEVIGEEPLDLPPQSFPTVALWFDLPPGMEALLAGEGLDFAGGLHAAEHAAIGLLPLFALCDRNDIGGVSTPLHADTGRPQIFIYDACPGGVGIAEKGFELVGELWEATLRAVRECPCQDGCPSCVQSPKCGNNNQPLDKKAAQRILEELLGKG